MARRFVAHVLSRDLDQAEVIVSLASAGNLSLSPRDLGGDGLKSFLESPVLLSAASEALAARALARSDDAISLKTVATWMQLSEEHERSRLFFAAANQLERPNSRTNESSETEFVSFE